MIRAARCLDRAILRFNMAQRRLLPSTGKRLTNLKNRVRAYLFTLYIIHQLIIQHWLHILLYTIYLSLNV